jgi:predicted MFS family arabinose efflux permease
LRRSEEHSTVAGMITSTEHASIALGPFFGGVISEFVGLRGPIWLGFSLSVIALLLFWVGEKKSK